MDEETDPKVKKRLEVLPLAIVLGALALVLFGALLLWHAQSQVNKIALSSSQRGVTVVEARAAMFRPSRRYVGTLEPWVEARVGPQLVSAYVDTVLVRPGATVRRGDVLATLDCRNASALSQGVAEQAHALETMQAALTHESQRVSQLQDGGFVSPNEVEQKTAESASKKAQVLAMQAQMLGSSLQVRDCVLRSPFDGEIASRSADPGAFAKPGSSIVSVVDRTLIRLTADVAEDDFSAVAPGTLAHIHVLPTGEDFIRPITRRSPSAEPLTRTIHIEIDIPDPDRRIPVYTTADLRIDVGEPTPATELPLAAVSIRQGTASLFTVQDGRARATTALVSGEAGGSIYLSPSLAAGTSVVLEGRTLLNDGDAVFVSRPIERRPELIKGADAAVTSPSGNAP